MKRAVIGGTAAAGIAITGAACSGSPAHHGAVAGSWAVASCEVDVNYVSTAKTADYYVPDTDVNFQHYFVPNQASGTAGIAVVITFVNDTGSPASLPTGLAVSFTDQSGNVVGKPQSFNSPYGSAVTKGQGSGEKFSASTLFKPGQTIAESPDISAVPQQSGLSCTVSQH